MVLVRIPLLLPMISTPVLATVLITGGEIMPNCAACGAEPEPSVHTPHTVYGKPLNLIGSQD